MEEKELLNNMVELADKEGKRVDSYISLISNFLKKNSAHWTSQHETIFQEMLKEIRSSRKYKTVFYIAVLFLVCVAVGLGLSEHAKANKEKLIQDIKNSQLAVRLKPSSHGLAVVYDKDSIEMRLDQKQKAERLYKEVGTVGVHYELGPEKELTTKRLAGDSLRWLVCPAALDDEQALGMIVLDQKVDELKKDVIQKGVDIPFPEFGNFFINLSDFETRTRPKVGKPEEMEQYTLWKVRFGEKVNSSIEYSEEYEIKQTDNGRIEVEPRLVKNPKWKHFYVVTVGLGQLGEDAGRIQAWNFNCVIRRFGFGTD